ncbi:unnamed protein product [Dracunculus medinensis]|uniref:WC-rich domain-containing protein n=1 Tax=Dracunculus medinensis TaxID=318479 RepID=A0A0N4U3W4_DRAME|nr:unnamed protein product [Dracunculus medinensis]
MDLSADDDVDKDSDEYFTPQTEVSCKKSSSKNEVTFVDNVSSILDPTFEQFSHPLLKHAAEYGARKVDAFMEFLLEKLQRQWITLFYMLIPLHQIQTLILICFVQLISFDTIMNILPIVTCYMAFGTMMFNTLRMFKDLKLLRQREIWLRILKIFSNDLSNLNDSANSRFSTISWEPYINFFISLSLFVLSMGMADKTLPNSILFFGVAILFAILCFVSLADSSDIFTIIAVVANFVSCLPIILKKMDLSMGYSILWKPLMEYRFYAFHFSVGLPSLALLIIPLSYIVLTRNKKLPDVLHIIIPHIVSLFNSLFVCLAWADIGLTFWLMYYRHFYLSGVLITMALTFLFISPSLIGIIVVASVPLVQLIYSIKMSFKWIKKKIFESYLGTAVDWKGSVQSIRVVRIDNSFETLLDYLPEVINQAIRCFYDLEISNTQHVTSLSDQCSLIAYNVYSFEIEISGPFGEHHFSSNKGLLILAAPNIFAEMLKMVDEGMVILCS